MPPMKTAPNIRYLICALLLLALFACHPNTYLPQQTPTPPPHPVAVRGPVPGFSPAP